MADGDDLPQRGKMGIQRFGAHMRGHAVKNVLGSTEAPAQKSLAIIDGPGLAHHIYYKLCQKHITTTGTITYADCADAVVRWLDDLRSIGFNIEAVIFDGALPPAKKDVRIGRLQSYVNRLQTYKQHIGSGIPRLSGEARQNLPPPAFLVFTIVEELLESAEYAPSTFVVQGEADPYCVTAAQSVSRADVDNVVIFSDDADLLVYQLDDHVSVVPFRDLAESVVRNGIVWTCEQYWPARIAQRAAPPLADLIKPAYYMAQDPHLTLDHAYRKVAKSDPTGHADFNEFLATFQTTRETKIWSDTKENDDLKTVLSARDSRVSELIYEAEALTTGDQQGALRMYLPFQLDDPARKSAWAVGSSLRITPYSLVLNSPGSEVSVQEYRRSGARISSNMIETLSPEATVAQLQDLSSYIEQTMAQAAAEELDLLDRWRYLIMQQTLSDIVADGYALPTTDETVQIVTNREPRKWHLIHLSAQYQAAYYSLRMTKQILAYVKGASSRTITNHNLIAKLIKQLEELPRIAVLFASTQSDPRRDEQKVWHKLLSEMIVALGGGDEEEDQGPKKRRKKSKKSLQESKQGRSLAKNPFAMLAED